MSTSGAGGGAGASGDTSTPTDPFAALQEATTLPEAETALRSLHAAALAALVAGKEPPCSVKDLSGVLRTKKNEFNNEWNGSACFMVIAALRCAHEAASKAAPAAAAPSNTDDTTKATAIAVAIASDEAKPSKKQQKEEWTLEGSWKEHFWNSDLEITISADGSLSGVYKAGQGFLTGTLARDGKQATCRWRETAASYGDHVERSGPFLPSLSADGQSFEAEWSQDTPPAGMPDSPWVCSRRKT